MWVFSDCVEMCDCELVRSLSCRENTNGIIKIIIMQDTMDDAGNPLKSLWFEQENLTRSFTETQKKKPGHEVLYYHYYMIYS